MRPEQVRAFLAAGTRTAKLATVSPDGAPHVVPVWFVLDGDDLIFRSRETSRKGQALRRDPRVALCVDDEQPPSTFVMVSGTATLSTDPDDLLRGATSIGGRNMGADRAVEFGRRNGVPGELLVQVAPTKTVSALGVAD